MNSKYQHFVDELTSQPSKDFNQMMSRLQELHDLGADVPRLITSSDGLSAESGEFKEIVKKMIWQGKPYNEDNIFHIKRELGDIAFYWVMACRAIGESPESVIEENIRKLESRYPGGKFSINQSEDRAEGDL